MVDSILNNAYRLTMIFKISPIKYVSMDTFQTRRPSANSTMRFYKPANEVSESTVTSTQILVPVY